MGPEFFRKSKLTLKDLQSIPKLKKQLSFLNKTVETLSYIEDITDFRLNGLNLEIEFIDSQGNTQILSKNISSLSESQIKDNVLNYDELLNVPSPELYQFAYVRESQGIKWQSSIGIGKYYGPGLYMWNGAEWGEDDTNIFTQLETLIQALNNEITDRVNQNLLLQQNIDAEEFSRNEKDTIIDEDLQLLKVEIPNYISNNSGQIKLNWDSTTRPSITGVVDAVQQSIPLNNNYTVSSFPTTTYPYLADDTIGGENVIEPTTAYLREIKVGQIITFRIKVGYSRKGANQQGAIILNISNPNPASSFNENLSIPALRGRTSYEQTVQISVIADGVSLDPLYGYELGIVTEFNDGNMDVYIQNITVVYGAVEIFNK